MNCKAIAFIALWFTASISGGWASIIHNSEVESRYFKVLDNRSHDYEIAGSWRWWLRVQRAIKATPPFAKKFAKQPLDLRGPDWKFKSGREKLQRFGLTMKQVEAQPSHVYTLHIASFRKEISLRSFLKEHWLGKRMEGHKFYRNISKGLKLLFSGEVISKSDPLYIKQVVVRGQRATRLCYGVYESVEDANADRRVLERYLSLHIQVVREQPTTELIREVLFKSVKGRVLDGWETKS